MSWFNYRFKTPTRNSSSNNNNNNHDPRFVEAVAALSQRIEIKFLGEEEEPPSEAPASASSSRRSSSSHNNSSNNNNNNNSNNGEEEPSVSLWQRCRAAGSASRFFHCCRPHELFDIADGTGREIDLQRSFAPASVFAFLFKLIATAVSVATLTYWSLNQAQQAQPIQQSVQQQQQGDSLSSSAQNPNTSACSNYLTVCGLALCCLYFPLSTWNTVVGLGRGEDDDDDCYSHSSHASSRSHRSRISASTTTHNSSMTGRRQQNVVNVRFRLAWLLLELAAHTNGVVTILFWAAFYNDNSDDALSYLTIAPHGGTLALLLMDGLVVNRSMPIRWVHWYILIFPFDALSYTVCVVIVPAVTGEPNTTMNTWQTALIWAVILVLGLSPLVYTFLWCLSAFCRKYVSVNNNNNSHHPNSNRRRRTPRIAAMPTSSNRKHASNKRKKNKKQKEREEKNNEEEKDEEDQDSMMDDVSSSIA